MRVDHDARPLGAAGRLPAVVCGIVLVVPGDVKGGRYVSDLVELRVVRATS